MIHEMKLRSTYFNLIKDGVKIYEVRLNDEKRQLIKKGDTIIFKKEPELSEVVNTLVTDLIYFKSFEEMANTLPAKQIGFEGVSVESIVNTYHEFYLLENENKYGVLALKVKVM